MRHKAETQRQWMRRIINRFDEVEKLQPKFTDFAAYPKWVQNLWLILIPVAHPKLHLKANQTLSVRQFGSLWGRQYALTAVQRGEVELTAKTVEEKSRGIALMKQSDSKFGQFLESCFEKSKCWHPAFVAFMKETLASVCGRPHSEAVVFFEAFGKAVVIKPTDLETDRTMGVGEKLAFAMIHNWRAISKLESVGELHKILAAALKPHGIVIGLKRVEKLCQRIGLKFKGRGRPRKG
jgi:hypothetical protein